MSAETTAATVGPYRLERLIGRGGMGEVFQAFDTRRQRTVALKLLPESLSGDQEYRARFRRESLAAASLTSPHVVPIHDFGEVEGRLFIDMRLIDGADLAQRIAGRPMSSQRAVSILLQICDALADAHSRGIVHRDVKPSNILITDNDFAYLVDFGIAASGNSTTSLTATGTTIGTFGYMAPERFDGAPSDPRADIYSLGCVLHEALTGTRPFAEHNSMPSLIKAHLVLAAPAPSASQASVSRELDQITLTAMSKEPSERYSSALELARALASIPIAGAAGAAAEVTSFAPTGWSPRQGLIETRIGTPVAGDPEQTHATTGPPPRRRSTMVLAAAVALALLTAGAIGGSMLSRMAPSSQAVSETPLAVGGSRSVIPWSVPSEAAQPAPTAFGETLPIGDGITATASTPEPYRPSGSAAGDEGATRFVRVLVTLRNDSGRYVNFGERFYPQMKTDGVTSRSVIDFAFNAGGDPGAGGIRSEATPPGRSVTFGMAWPLTDRTTPIELTVGPLNSNPGTDATWAGDV